MSFAAICRTAELIGIFSFFPLTFPNFVEIHEKNHKNVIYPKLKGFVQPTSESIPA